MTDIQKYLEGIGNHAVMKKSFVRLPRKLKKRLQRKKMIDMVHKLVQDHYMQKLKDFRPTALPSKEDWDKVLFPPATIALT